MSNTLQAGQKLLPGQKICSASGRFSLIYQTDGDLVLLDENLKAVWSSGTRGQPAFECVMGTDGNLSLFTPTQNRYWTSNIAGSSQSRLVLEDDRNLVIYRMDNRPAWASNTSLSPAPTATMDTLNAGQKLAPGQKLVSANGRYSLVYQGDGNLVLYDENLKSIWSATFARQSAGECVMEADGNLCLYSSARTLYWSTRLSQSGQNRLVLQDNRNLVIFRSDNTPVWASNTAL